MNEKNQSVETRNLSMLLDLAVHTNMKNGVKFSQFQTTDQYMIHGLSTYFKDLLDTYRSESSPVPLAILQAITSKYHEMFQKTMNRIPNEMKNPNPNAVLYRMYYQGGNLEFYTKDFYHDTRYLETINGKPLPYPDSLIDAINPENPPKYVIWADIRGGIFRRESCNYNFHRLVAIVRTDVAMNADDMLDLANDLSKFFNIIQYAILHGIYDTNGMFPNALNGDLRNKLLALDLDTLHGPLNLDAIRTSEEDNVQPEDKTSSAYGNTECWVDPYPTIKASDLLDRLNEIKVSYNVPIAEDEEDGQPEPADQSFREDEPSSANDNTEYLVGSSSRVKASDFTETELQHFMKDMLDEPENGNLAEDLWPRLRQMNLGDITDFLKRLPYNFYNGDIIKRLATAFCRNSEDIRNALNASGIITWKEYALHPRQSVLFEKFRQFLFRDDKWETAIWAMDECYRAIRELRKSDVNILLALTAEYKRSMFGESATYKSIHVTRLKTAIYSVGLNDEKIHKMFRSAGFVEN